MPVVRIFSYTIMTYLKTFVGTKFLNTKQCPVGLFPRIMSHVSVFLPKMFPPLMLHCCICQVWTVPLSLESHFSFVLISVIRKISLNKSSLTYSVIPSPYIAIFMLSPYTRFICSCSHCSCVIFELQALCTQFMLILINWYLLSVVFSMTKALF